MGAFVTILLSITAKISPKFDSIFVKKRCLLYYIYNMAPFSTNGLWLPSAKLPTKYISSSLCSYILNWSLLKSNTLRFWIAVNIKLIYFGEIAEVLNTAE